MGHVEQRSNGPAHAMDQGHRRIVESHARFQGRHSHFFPGLSILPLPIGGGQIGKNPFHRGQRQGVRQRLGLFGGIGLNAVGQCVQARGSRYPGRSRQRQRRIYHGQVRQQGRPFQQHFYLGCRIRNNGKLGSFRPSARRGGNGNHSRQRPGNLLAQVVRQLPRVHRQHPNGLHGIQRAAAPQTYEKITARSPVFPEPFQNHGIRGFPGNPVVQRQPNTLLFQQFFHPARRTVLYRMLARNQ